MNDFNTILSTMNYLYWFKDADLNDKENKLDYLKTLKKLAVELKLEGLEKEITDSLKLL